MRRVILVFLTIASLTAPIIAFGADEETAPAPAKQYAPITVNMPGDPSSAINRILRPGSKKAKAPVATAPARAQPVVEKEEKPEAGSEGRKAKASFSKSGGSQKVVIKFNNRPKIVSTNRAPGKISIYFDADFDLSASIPRGYSDFESIEKAETKRGVAIVITYAGDKQATSSYSGNNIGVTVSGKDDDSLEIDEEEAPKPEKTQISEKKPVATPKPTPAPVKKPAVKEKAAIVKVEKSKTTEPAKPMQTKAQIKKIDNQDIKTKEPAAKVEAAHEAKPPVKEEVKEAAKAEEKKEEKKVEAAKPIKKAAAKVEFTKEGDIERLKFTFSSPAPAAIFERFGYYWLVFYSDDEIQLPDLKKSQLFGTVKKLAALKSENINPEDFPSLTPSPLIFNLELIKNAYAMAEKNENEWLIEFDPNIKYEQDKPLKLDETPENWEIAAPGLSGRVTIKDDFTNDYIEVFPLNEPGGVPQNVSTNKFILERTAQGVALKPIGAFEMRADGKDKIKIFKSPADKISAEPKKPDAPAEALFPFQKWKQLNADEYRKTERELRNGDHYEFGKFLFSQGLYAEAAVNLEGVRGMQASFLTAASYYMLGRYEEAIKIFESLSPPAGVDRNELLIWLAAANYELYNTNPDAAKTVDLTNFYLAKNVETYPDEVRNRLIFSIAERLITDGRYDDAQGFLNVLPKTGLGAPAENYAKYLQAKIYDAQNKHARAREIWDEVEKARADRKSRAKSAYEIINQDYTANKISTEEAIKQLNDIRIIWRGDMFEYDLLNKLADLYVKSGNNYEALELYKEILTSFPRFPRNVTIATQMSEIYQSVLNKDFADKEKTFQALAIYYEFEELKPIGDQGDKITMQLADSLAKYDLLNDAANVLQKYSTSLNDGAQKAEIGTRIAILRFLDNKYKEALEALKTSQSPNLPNYLVQERRILEVRCLIEIGELEKANSLLSALPDEQANRFKTDIFWKQKKWHEMIYVYDIIAEKSDEDIMRMAIAYVLLGDKKNLQKLDKDYSARMDKSAYALNFDFITDTENVDYRNLDTSLKLDETEQSLQQYRQRLKTNGLAAVIDKNPPAVPAKK